MDTPNTYIIRGGVEGQKRLDVLTRVLEPTTARLLTQAGVAPGMSCLDLGCAGGDVTLQLAPVVGPQGHVVGVDRDEATLDLARQEAARRGLANVEFRRLDAEAWAEESCYDCVYARFLLSHLRDPLGVLRRMWRAVRPSGVAIVEDVNFAGHLCYPPCAGFATFVRLYQHAAAQRGADADIGPKLFSMCVDAGWRTPQLGVIQPTFASGEGKQIALLTLRNIADAVLASQLFTATELQAALDDLARFTDDPRTLMSLARIFQLWARRE